MTGWMRGGICLVWLAALGWLWAADVLGTFATLATAVGGTALVLLGGASNRRRRSDLQYVEMGKAPVGLL